MRRRVTLKLGAWAVAASVGAWALAACSPSGGTPVASPTHASTQSASPTPSATSMAQAVQATQAAATRGMQSVFNQSFAGHQLDPTIWATCYPWMDAGSGCTNFGNAEFQWYMPSQDRIRVGSLHLVAQPEAAQGRTKSGGPKIYACRSGMITSFPGFRFKYGFVSVVARVPDGAGLWTGLWLAAADKRWPPEVDMLERWGPPGNVAGVYLHTRAAPKHAIEKHLTPEMAASLSTGWHTFSLLWTSNLLTWYIDGQQIMVVRNHSPRQLMYIIANLADFKAVPRGCDGQLLIKSVQVWQRPAR